MRDLRGQPYSRLPTAFQYRTTYDESCKCKPHPWEQEAQDRHRMYALQQSVRKGNKEAIAELKGLQEKLGQQNPGLAQTAATPAATPRDRPPPGMMALGAKSAPKSKAMSREAREAIFNR